MNFIRNRATGTQQAVRDLQESGQGGPIVSNGVDSGAPHYNVRQVPARSRVERIGFWIIVAASVALLLVLLGVVLPPVMGGVIAGFYMSLFVGGLTLMNTSRGSAWANAVLGRQIFPIIRASHADIWRLAGVNAALTFAFTFAFYVIAQFLGGFFAGLIVFGGLIAAGVFYNRARKVIIKP